MACCGQLICGGCAHASSLICKKMKKSELCAFCRSETGQDDKAMVAQLRSRLEKNDVSATTAAKKGDWGGYSLLGCIYAKQEDVENAAKHLIFAARAGHEISMEFLRS